MGGCRLYPPQLLHRPRAKGEPAGRGSGGGASAVDAFGSPKTRPDQGGRDDDATRSSPSIPRARGALPRPQNHRRDYPDFGLRGGGHRRYRLCHRISAIIEGGPGGLFILVGGLLYAAVVALFLFAYAEIIRLIIAVEDNTRVTAEALAGRGGQLP